MTEGDKATGAGEVRAKSNELRTALITVIVAVISAIATVGGAYLGGFFDVAKTDAAARGNIRLEQLKFSNGLIKGALASNNPANSLLFYADIGLLDGLNIGKVKEYAIREMDRLKHGGGGSSILPSFGRAARPSALWLDRSFMAAFAPKAKSELVNALVSTGNYLFLGFGIDNSAQRLADFLAEIAYETTGLTKFEDDGDYSAADLMKYFPTKFDGQEAKEYAHHPKKTLNYVNANELGNGPAASGDAWKFRARGFLWFAGRAEYARYSKETGVDLLTNPQIMGDPQISLLISALYWYRSGLNTLADENRFVDIVKKVNGGTVDLEQQRRYANLALRLLNERAKAATQ